MFPKVKILISIIVKKSLLIDKNTLIYNKGRRNHLKPLWFSTYLAVTDDRCYC